MTRRPRFPLYLLLAAFACALAGGSAEAQNAVSQGRILGVVNGTGGDGISGVLVLLEPSGRTTATDQQGAYVFDNLPAGEYALVISAGDLEARVSGLRVGAAPVTVTSTLPRDFQFVASTTVTAASKSPERIVDAPGAVTRVSAETIALEGGAGQVPALLQFTVGADFTQSGIYDINFNARGFNNLLSRRVQTLVDGRDTAAPESSVQEWYSLGFLLPDLESIELLRGPSASLYGANTVNGVMTLKTKAPRDSLGGRLRLTLGELETVMADARVALPLGRRWYMKVVANSTHSNSFTTARTTTVEYPGLPMDAIAPAEGGIDARSGIVRLDRYLRAGDLFVNEAGYSQSGGETFVSQAGRPQIDDARRAWARSEYSSPWWNVAAELNHRRAEQTHLQAGLPLDTNSLRGRVTVQGHRYAYDARIRTVFGGTYQRERVDSADAQGVQTLYLHAVTANHGAAFGQLDYLATSRLKLVAGIRWDDASIHPAQVSPRLAAVYQLPGDHSVRVGYNRGFQVGTYTELYLRLAAAPPADLTALEAALSPLTGGAPLGFNHVPVLAIGNPSLDVEQIRSVEFGYTGAFGTRGRIGVDFYQNYMADFISDLLFGINPAYPAYRAPATLPEPARAVIEQTVNGLVPGLTNRADGGPQIVLSNANTGRVHSRGLELSAGVRPLPALWLDANYAWFDFTLKNRRPGAEPQPNAPAHRFALGATYREARVAASLRYRWVQTFPWASGIYVGTVPSYGVADLNASVTASRHWQLGVNVSNLLDNRHYEMFGGDLLGRRALVHPTFSW